MGLRSSGWKSFIDAGDEKPRMTPGLIKRVLRYARPYRWQITGTLVLILIATGLSMLTPLVLRDLIDHALPDKDIPRLLRNVTAIFLLPLTSAAVNIVQRNLSARVSEGVVFDLRSALYNHLQRMSLRFFTHTRVGELMSRLNNDVVGAQNAISNTIVGIITNTLQAAAVLALMFSLEWRLALISLLVFPLFFLLARRMGGTLRDFARKDMEAHAAMNAMMHETLNISGALLVKLFGRRGEEIARFETRAEEVRDLGIRRAVWRAILMTSIGLLSAVGLALVYGIGGYLVIRGAFTIGTIVAFVSYMNNLYGALQQLSNAPVDFATSMVSFERVFEVIDLPVEISDAPEAVRLGDVAGELVFEGVSFQYETEQMRGLSAVYRPGAMDSVTAALSGDAPADEAPEEGPGAASQARHEALVDISFRAESGQLVALVGPSGAGKTTLTYLIPRLYDPIRGRITLDGHDLRQVTLDSLNAQIGMVTQETHLFHDTIRTNLLYARLDATQAELEAAARAANIHHFIADLPHGYDTVVGERGYRLSGGEKQRLALARVILKNPRILVLDEATSSLDSESEALIQEALKRVMAGRTSIVIAHRLSTILAADLILVLDRGQIVERGTHNELLALNGLYTHLYNTQFNRA